MLQFIWFYIYHVTLVPLWCILSLPFYKMDAQHYMKGVIRHGLQIDHSIVCKEPFVHKGFILANHRSWADFVVDQCVANASILGRRLGFLAVPFPTLLSSLDNRCVIFIRGQDSRSAIYQKCVDHIANSSYKRIVMFPEGTRMSYLTLESVSDAKTYLKFGLLKEIYKDQTFPVQIMISNNKEVVFNKKKMTIQYGVKVKTLLSKAIYPRDYPDESAFFDAIAKEWYESWNKIYNDCSNE
jgi:hypothetical protein